MLESKQFFFEKKNQKTCIHKHLPGCMSDGDTVADAMANTAEAQAGWPTAAFAVSTPGFQRGDKLIAQSVPASGHGEALYFRH